MNIRTISILTVLLTAVVVMAAACSQSSEPQPPAPSATTASAQPVASAEPVAAAETLSLLVVHKSPSCGCCGLWVEHMQQAGFPVEVRDTNELNPIKARLGVPYGKGSCHTAEVAGYVVEGHVPADDVKRLLAQRPDAKGLVLPGMPLGSPGMETPDGRTDAYTVELIANDGTTSAFAEH
ncbi:MAG TPA: DUF411 domain-containing protein [Lysobacter sp.]|nr:DUF411 domain-containing protein [Lysobacter sp.]